MEEEVKLSVAGIETIIQGFVEKRLAKCDKLKRYTVAEIHTLLFMPTEINVIGCVSSNVKAYGYDEKTEALAVEFNGGGQYRYLGVPKGVFEILNQSESKGRSINEIKVRYNFVRWL